MKFTKIVATISDKRCDVDFLRKLADAGMNVVRMNSAHLEYEGIKKIVGNVRQADERSQVRYNNPRPCLRQICRIQGRGFSLLYQPASLRML